MAISICSYRAGFAVLLMCVVHVPVEAQNIVIENVALFDSRSSRVRERMTVTIRGGRFSKIVPSSFKKSRRGKIIDGTGLYLIPGLIDVHVHIAGAGQASSIGKGALASFLYAGVTTILDAGNRSDYILSLRTTERFGLIQAPRIMATGSVVASRKTDREGDSVIAMDDWQTDSSGMSIVVRNQKPDLLKLVLGDAPDGATSELSVHLAGSVIGEARRRHLRTTAHVIDERQSTQLVEGGIDTLAHPVILTPVSDDYIRLVVRRHVPIASTLTIGDYRSRAAQHPEFFDEPLYAASLSRSEIADIRVKALRWSALPSTMERKRLTTIALNNLKRIADSGGTIALGTDQGIGAAAHREMELLQSAGITPAKILTIATMNGAIYLGRTKEIGAIERGKLADAVLLSADPTSDVRNVRSIIAVIKNGVLIDEDSLPLSGGRKPLRRLWR